jgi:hypothetical protein
MGKFRSCDLGGEAGLYRFGLFMSLGLAGIRVVAPGLPRRFAPRNDGGAGGIGGRRSILRLRAR